MHNARFLIGAVLALLAALMPARAATNLVATNPSFESFITCNHCWKDGSTNPKASWGARQLMNDARGDGLPSMTGWQVSGYAFLGMNLTTAVASGGWLDRDGDSQSMAAAISASTDGGKFLALGGQYSGGMYVEQQVTGLTAGASYDLSFYMATVTLAGTTNNKAHKMSIRAGFVSGDVDVSPEVSVVRNKFSGWSKVTMTLKANASSHWLRLTPLVSTGDVSETSWVLLDGVVLTARLPDHIEAVPDATTASTCTPLGVTLKACADAACTTLMTDYTGTVNLTTSKGTGKWALGASPVPGGTLANNASSNGQASYTFVSGDAGKAKLTLSNGLAQSLTITSVDSTASGTSDTSASIAFSDNVFTFSEDAGDKVAGSWIAVAGRPHDITVTYTRKDPSTGVCGAATEYTGDKTLKIRRTDQITTWTAPTLSGSKQASMSVPGTAPASNNITLNFAAGVASFNIGTTDIGRYSFTLTDDSKLTATNNVTGDAGPLTVRPFALVVSDIKAGSVANPGSTTATGTVLGTAGGSFQLSLGGYRWAASMAGTVDAGGGITPSSSATLAQVTAGGLAPSFGSTASGISTVLRAKTGTQVPSTGVLGSFGTLSGSTITAPATLSGFSGGSITPTNLAYNEVGSFTLDTASGVSNYLGVAGLNLAIAVYNSAGTRVTTPVVGRFVPAGFALSGGSVVHRTLAACSPASTFTYVGEPFQLAYTLTARNAQGGTTANYTGSFARLDLASKDTLGPAGIDGSTALAVNPASASGSWSNGVSSSASLIASVARGSTPAGPYASARIGLLPADPDGVTLLAGELDLDTSVPANTADRALVATVPLRWGRLRLQNAIGSNERVLRMPLAVQYWSGSQFVTNIDDSCTRVDGASLSLGNYTKTLTASNTSAPSGNWKVDKGAAIIPLPAPSSTAVYGSYDVALGLGIGTTDASCLKDAGWAPGRALTAAANMSFLQGAWCGSAYSKDPAAKASFGLYRGSNATIYERRNF